MSQNVKVYRTLEFYKEGGGARMASFDCDDSSTILYLRPEDNDSEAFHIGDGTDDMDVKIFLGSTSKHVLFDVSTSSMVVTGTGIQIGGTYEHGIKFTEDPVAGDNTNSFINIGEYGAAIEVAPAGANMFGVMHNVALTAVNVSFWYQAYYTKITTSGTTTDTSVAGHAYRMMIGSDLGAVYGIQCHTYLTDTISIPTEVISVSAYLEITANKTVTSGRVAAFQAMLYSEGTPASVVGDCVVAHIANAGTISTTDVILRIVNQTGATAVAALQMDLGGSITYAIDFQGSVSDAWTSGDLTGNDEYAAFGKYSLIPVKVQGVATTVYLIAAQTWKNVSV